jgi:L-ascorbate metabolism protein UlaG (beta-lactamase superfamily)
MKVTWFGRSAFRIEVGAARILIDPFLSETRPGTRGGRNPPRVSPMCCSRMATTITSATRSPC